MPDKVYSSNQPKESALKKSVFPKFGIPFIVFPKKYKKMGLKNQFVYKKNGKVFDEETGLQKIIPQIHEKRMDFKELVVPEKVATPR